MPVTTSDILLVCATIAGPVLAVQAQKWIERATERRRARRAIFHALMSNRATRLSDEFVRALNLIDLEFGPRRFGGSKDRAVINAWRALFGEYQQGAGGDADEAIARAWNQRVNDLVVTLLSAMAKSLGYDFSEEELRRGIYYPKGRADLEQAQLAILNGLKELLAGNAIPMKITEAPSSPELIAIQTEMLQKSVNSYGEDGAVKVRIVGE